MKKTLIILLSFLCLAACHKTTAPEGNFTNVIHPEWAQKAVIYQINVRQFSPEGTFAAVEPQLDRLAELGQRAKVAGMELRHFRSGVALHNIELADLHFRIQCGIIDDIVGLEDAGTDLDQGITADERIHDGLEDVCGFRLCVVIVRLESVAALHIRAADLAVLR